VLLSLPRSPSESLLRDLLGGLVQGYGLRLPQSPTQREDNSLRGWPWIDKTFSWVEPTSWCLLALKKSLARFPDSRTERRIAEAEQLLVDRCCRPGGWNYGNSNVLGQELHPYVPTTALALLAMQDRRNEPAVQRSLADLEANWHSEISGMALSLTSVCFRVYGLGVDEVDRRLDEQHRRTGFLKNQHIMAMASYSLEGASHDVAAFRI
jgi:hypothetical protein